MFPQIQNLGLKAPPVKNQWGKISLEFFWQDVWSRNCTNASRDHNFFQKAKTLDSVKTVQRYLVIAKIYRQCIPRINDKVIQLQLLLSEDVLFKLSKQHNEAVFEVVERLLKVSKLSLKLLVPKKQPVILCDVSEQAAGYVLLIKDYTDEETEKSSNFILSAFSY